MPSLRECLRQVYSGIYVEYATKNPLQPLGTPVTSTYFAQVCESAVLVKSLARLYRQVPAPPRPDSNAALSSRASINTSVAFRTSCPRESKGAQ